VCDGDGFAFPGPVRGDARCVEKDGGDAGIAAAPGGARGDAAGAVEVPAREHAGARGRGGEAVGEQPVYGSGEELAAVDVVDAGRDRAGQEADHAGDAVRGRQIVAAAGRELEDERELAQVVGGREPGHPTVATLGEGVQLVDDGGDTRARARARQALERAHADADEAGREAVTPAPSRSGDAREDRAIELHVIVVALVDIGFGTRPERGGDVLDRPRDARPAAEQLAGLRRCGRCLDRAVQDLQRELPIGGKAARERPVGEEQRHARGAVRQRRVVDHAVAQRDRDVLDHLGDGLS
jgi:hypothetical protein